MDHQVDLLSPELEVSDYLLLREALDESVSQSVASPEKAIDGGSGGGSGSVLGGSMSVASRNNNTMKCKNGIKKKGKHIRVAFRTKSDTETMEDGFKWRKYGKKSVKNSPNPRNYYKCLSGGCQVKKIVERDGEDSSYVVTTYEGVHNHESPFGVHSNQNNMFSKASWTFQPPDIPC